MSRGEPIGTAEIQTPEDVIRLSKAQVRDYPQDPGEITIVTICSHSSLQLFDAARRAGFRTLGIIRENDPSRQSYDIFPNARPDDFVTVPQYTDFIASARNG